ncbi:MULTISPECIES: GntR family transcriptional regulator [Kocuria]|uniref:GntR family transcriptional regulator n=1 Tax=Kocuria TaxID=57493 RepID=UPI00065F8EA0|nr:MULTISPECIES: GntR family transcriptional regulator [Kocuria]MCT1367180.1 GntR family transcriptional regulator [Rothia sp. p3-SID1597]RUQ21877.1 GntR family transcriptional regulator [Kocuria sp. HSID16901]
MVHKHEKVRTALRRYALTELSPGASLPGERQLEKHFGVSRITVRRAVADLVAEGVLVRIHGKGTFVSHGRVRSDLHLASFTEDMGLAGLQPSTQILVAEPLTPPSEVSEFFGLGANQPTLCIKRLRSANDAPVSVDESWMRPDLTEFLLAQDLTKSLYGHLSTTDFPVRSAHQTVEATSAESELAQVLDIAEASPVLRFIRHTFSVQDGAPVPLEYSISTYRSDRYQLSMHLQLSPDRSVNFESADNA